MLGSLGVFLAVLSVVVLSTIQFRKASVKQASELVSTTAWAYSSEIEQRFENALFHARSFALVLTGLIDSKHSGTLTREDVELMGKQILLSDNDFIGLTIAWEPNAFDGKDAKYVNTPYSDRTGRFISYLTKGPDDKVVIEPLIDYETPEKGPWYWEPKKTMKDFINGPVWYPVQGKDVFMISFMCPIIHEGKFLGVTGIDFSINYLQTLFSSSLLFGGASEITLLNSKGVYAAHSTDFNKVGAQTTEKIQKPDWQNLKDKNPIQKQKLVKDNGKMKVTIPLRVGSIPDNWYVVVKVPMTEVMAASWRNMWEMVLLSLALSILFIISLQMFFKHIVTVPITSLTEIINKLSVGNLKTDVPVSSYDEISLLSLAISKLRENLNKAVEFAGQIGNGNLDVEYTPLGPDDELGNSLILMQSGLIEAQKEQKKWSENLEKSAEIKKQFLANMSHEIRTPLTGILGMAEFLAKTPLNDVQKNYATTILQSSNNLLNIINDILDLAKIESGKMELKPEVFSLSDFNKRMYSLFSPLARQKNIEFVTHIDASAPQWIKADVNRLNQVISNLLSNAIKFTHQGSVSLSFECKGDNERFCNLIVEVKDTGVGIKKESLNKLFQSFSQVDNSLKREHDGTGLGLFISQNLVNLMGGSIEVESEEGKGSRFWFSIKVKIASEPLQLSDDSAESMSTQVLSGLKVLLVEDKVVNQKVISMMLAEMGCQVVIANNGLDALIKVDKMLHEDSRSIDLIFMDIQMPVMDGITAVKELKNKHADLPPVVAISANAMAGDAERYISQGMDDYISKPVSINQLLIVLKKWTDKKTTTIISKQEVIMEEQHYQQFEVLDKTVIYTILQHARGDKEIIDELLSSFYEDVTELLTTIEENMNAEHESELKQALHSLAGLAGTIGGVRLKEMARDAENHIKQGNILNALKIAPFLKKAFEDFKLQADGLDL